MVLNIHLNEMTQDFVFSNTVTAGMSEWMGRGVAIVKSGIATALSCLQDKRIAVISLIAVTLLMHKAVILSLNALRQSSYDQAFKVRVYQNGFSFIEINMGELAILSAGVAGVIGFAQCTKLPLSALAIFGISVATFILREAYLNFTAQE